MSKKVSWLHGSGKVMAYSLVVAAALTSTTAVVTGARVENGLLGMSFDPCKYLTYLPAPFCNSTAENALQPQLPRQQLAAPGSVQPQAIFTTPTEEVRPQVAPAIMIRQEVQPVPSPAPDNRIMDEPQLEVFPPLEQGLPAPVMPEIVTGEESSPAAGDCSQETEPSLEAADDFETFVRSVQALEMDPCFSSQKCSNGSVAQEDATGRCACSDVSEVIGERQCEQEQQLDDFCESSASAGKMSRPPVPSDMTGPPPPPFHGSNLAGSASLPMVQILQTRLLQAYTMEYNRLMAIPPRFMSPQMKSIRFRALSMQYNWLRNRLTMYYAGM